MLTQRNIQHFITKVRKEEALWKKCSLEEQQTQLDTLKSTLSQATEAEFQKELPRTFGILLNIIDRALGLQLYDVQIQGAYYLVKGSIIEMKTGEGKTVTAMLAGFARALQKKGVHVITTNEYLAERDATTAKSIADCLEMTVGWVYNKQNVAEKKVQYQADITYGTASEFGFDYLRDHLATQIIKQVQRPFSYVIIDEADSILIDEARTPLIIAASDKSANERYKIIQHMIQQLNPSLDVTIDIKTKTVELTALGIEKFEEAIGADSLFDNQYRDWMHAIYNGLKANFIFEKDIDYIVSDGRVQIVDLFTGRVLEGRRFAEGLHQAIEAKENVEIQNETYTNATISLQSYFKKYPLLSGMTGTAWGERKELKNCYNVKTYRIPTHRPIIREDLPDILCVTMKGKFQLILEEIQRVHATGQPILIGTTSIEMSQRLSVMLSENHLSHALLNAKEHEKEAKIIAQAGQRGSITIATNMAGRGTDIILGPGVAELGGLYVIGTERHESRRIDDQLRGRSGRQGDPGRSRFYLSLEDELLKRFGGQRFDALSEQYKKQGNDQFKIENKLIGMQINRAQARIEGNHYDARKQLLDYDEVLNRQRDLFYNSRGLILTADNVYYDIIPNIISEVAKQLIYRYTLQEVVEVYNQNFNPTQPLSYRTLKRFKKRQQRIQYIETLLHNQWRVKSEAFESGLLHLFALNRLLTVFDSQWIVHIGRMLELRTVARLKAYGQTDPLNEYKKEAYSLYNQLRFDCLLQGLTACLNDRVVEHLDQVEVQGVQSI